MIQRVQSIYLLAIITLLCYLSFGTLLRQWNHENDTFTEYRISLGSFTVLDQLGAVTESRVEWMTLAPAIAMMGYVLFILFSFRDRMKQIRLCKLNFLFFAVLAALAFYNAYSRIPGLHLPTAFKTFPFGMLLLFFIPYLNLRTIMHIRRDEELVRSADRIR